MKEFGTPAKLISSSKMILSRAYSKVKIQKKLPRTFRTGCGIRQGDSLSRLLFNIGLGKVMRYIGIYPCGTIFNKTRQFISYNDDSELWVLNDVHSQLNTAAEFNGW